MKDKRLSGVVAAVSLKYKKFRFRVGADKWFEAKDKRVTKYVTPELKGCKVEVRHNEEDEALFIEILEKPVQGGRSDETSTHIIRQNCNERANELLALTHSKDRIQSMDEEKVFDIIQRYSARYEKIVLRKEE